MEGAGENESIGSIDGEQWYCKLEHDKFEEGITYYQVGKKAEVECLLAGIVCMECFRYSTEEKTIPSSKNTDMACEGMRQHECECCF
jgi:hypothetical protein